MRKVIILLLTVFFCLTGCTQNRVYNNSKNESNNVINSSTDLINNSVSSGELSMNTSDFLEKNEQQEKTNEILLKSSTEKIDTVIRKSYPQEELIRDVVFNQTDNFNTMLDWIDGKYPIECIRTFNDKSLSYCVYELKEGGFLFIFFHGESLKFADCAFVIKESHSKIDYETIKPGKSLDDVEKIDSGLKLYNSLHPDNFYYVQNAKTYHMVKEGFLIISYKSAVADHGSNFVSTNFIVESVDFVPNGSLLNNNNYSFLQGDFPK